MCQDFHECQFPSRCVSQLRSSFLKSTNPKVVVPRQMIPLWPDGDGAKCLNLKSKFGISVLNSLLRDPRSESPGNFLFLSSASVWCRSFFISILCPFLAENQPGMQNGSVNPTSLSVWSAPTDRWLSPSWAWRLVGSPPGSPPPRCTPSPPAAPGEAGAPTLTPDHRAAAVGWEDPTRRPGALPPMAPTSETKSRCCPATEGWSWGWAGFWMCSRPLTPTCWGSPDDRAQWGSWPGSWGAWWEWGPSWGHQRVVAGWAWRTASVGWWRPPGWWWQRGWRAARRWRRGVWTGTSGGRTDWCRCFWGWCRIYQSLTTAAARRPDPTPRSNSHSRTLWRQKQFDHTTAQLDETSERRHRTRGGRFKNGRFFFHVLFCSRFFFIIIFVCTDVYLGDIFLF